jgi:hypothetical protein
MDSHKFGYCFVLLSSVLISMFVSASFSSAQVVELKPDLQAFPAFSLVVTTDTSGHKLLRFSTRTWNSGDGPLELRAGETGSAGQNVYQRVYLSDGGYYDRLAGTFVWHPAHNHFHFDDYALYTLQPVNAPGGSKREGAKTTFCIMDTNAINTTLPGAPQQPVYATCGASIQGMSVGWADTYGYTLAGQSIDITGLPNGDYALSIEADYKSNILETNEGNNTSCMLVRLNVTNSTVQVLNPNNCTYVVVSSITPNAAPRNSVTFVTIKGVGFTTGMTVSFEGWSGPRPSAGNVIVVDETTITANVTVPKKAKIGSVWDVRVSSGVLVGGFAVVP